MVAILGVFFLPLLRFLFANYDETVDTGESRVGRYKNDRGRLGSTVKLPNSAELNDEDPLK